VFINTLTEVLLVCCRYTQYSLEINTYFKQSIC